MLNSPIVETNASLKEHNTFGVDVKADLFASVSTPQQLQEVLQSHKDVPVLYLGSGSNILFTGDFPGLVVHLNILGIETAFENEHTIHLQVGAGEDWPAFVEYCVEHGYGGIENLAMIPGTVGAAPVQNIGAYGRELQDVFASCDVLDRSEGHITTMEKDDCGFGYRDSVFKKMPEGNMAILKVTLELSKKDHILHTQYGALQETLSSNTDTQPTIKDVVATVSALRRAKLPDPNVLGNCGSFFKNPVVTNDKYQQLASEFPQLPAYPLPDGTYKIPAAWLIEKAGLKGVRKGNVGTHEKQALIIVNYGSATGEEIWQFAQHIQSRVSELFSIHLQPEVKVI